ncbi:MAG: hypothetical protein ACYS8I_13115 [Planctomycetota bacterium]
MTVEASPMIGIGSPPIKEKGLAPIDSAIRVARMRPDVVRWESIYVTLETAGIKQQMMAA